MSKPRRIQVKTRNCVPDEEIQNNVRYALTLDMPDFVVCRKQAGAWGIMASGGPSLIDNLDGIRDWRAISNNKIFCVKHAHDVLIKNGIIPDFCILLDPRGHVVDFIEEPHPEVTYLVGSICHPSTLDRLLEHKAKAFLYHPLVGAGEVELLKGKKLIANGCSSATRGIALAHAMGFRRFNLFGYDLIYPDVAPEESVRVTVGPAGVMEQPDGEFVTDYEKIAQANELRAWFKNMDMDFKVQGEGLALRLFEHRKELPMFRKIYA